MPRPSESWANAPGDEKFVSRLPALPSLAWPLALGTFQAVCGTGQTVMLIITGSLFHLVWIVIALLALALHARDYRSKRIRRAELRASNLDRVEDWIIKTELPTPSVELQKRLDADEAEYLVWKFERELQVCREEGMDRHHTWMRMHSMAHPPKAKDEPYEDYQRRYTVTHEWFSKWESRQTPNSKRWAV